VQELIDAGILFCGTPDQVYVPRLSSSANIAAAWASIIMMGHAGDLSHEDTVENLTLFAKEVLPRLKEYK